MQLAGSTCGICQKRVLVDTEATWCARCSTVVHRQCLTTATEMCPRCRAAYDSPERHFVFSRQCPECFRPNDPPQPRCSCGARTQWENQAALAESIEQMKDEARVRFIRGMAELGAATLCLLALVGFLVVSSNPGFIPLGLFLFGFMTLTADGLVSVMRSRRIGKFH